MELTIEQTRDGIFKEYILRREDGQYLMSDGAFGTDAATARKFADVVHASEVATEIEAALPVTSRMANGTLVAGWDLPAQGLECPPGYVVRVRGMSQKSGHLAHALAQATAAREAADAAEREAAGGSTEAHDGAEIARQGAAQAERGLEVARAGDEAAGAETASYGAGRAELGLAFVREALARGAAATAKASPAATLKMDVIRGYHGNWLHSITAVSRAEYDAILASPPATWATTKPEPGTMLRRAQYVDESGKPCHQCGHWAPAAADAGVLVRLLSADDARPVGPVRPDGTPYGHIRLAWLALLGALALLLLAPVAVADAPPVLDAGTQAPADAGVEAPRHLTPRRDPWLPLIDLPRELPRTPAGDEPSPSTGERPG